MVPLNLTRYTLVVILVGIGLAIAVFRPEISLEGMEGPTKQALTAGEPTPAPASGQPENASSVPVDEIDSHAGQANLETEQQRLEQEWALLWAEQAKLAQERKDLDAEKALVAQERADLESQKASLVQEQKALQVEQGDLAGEWERLEAERADLAGRTEELLAEQALLEDVRGKLETWEVNLQEEEQRVERLQNLNVAAFALGSLMVGLMILLAAAAVWKDKRGRAEARKRETPGVAHGRRPIGSPKVPSPTYGGNGKGRKEVVRIS
jgi:hypothetical protein